MQFLQQYILNYFKSYKIYQRRTKNNNKILIIVTKLESGYYTILTSCVFTNVDTTSSFRGIIKIKQFQILKIKSKY